MILDVPIKKIAISENLRRLREQRKLNQKAFPRVSYRTIQNIEAGIKDGGAAELAEIAEKLDVSIDELVFGPDIGTSQVMAEKEAEFDAKLRLLNLIPELSGEQANDFLLVIQTAIAANRAARTASAGNSDSQNKPKKAR